MSAIPDPQPVRAFLDEEHVEFAAAIGTWAARELNPRPEPSDDAAGRTEARALLTALGTADWLEPIRRGDWRACCLAREALAAASPLADAVFALQALGVVPLQLSDNDAMRARWLDDAIRGRAMGAFAMTERDAGTDVAAMATTARRDGDHYVLNGRKVFISNAGIADYYNVFATTDPAAGGKGIACFVVPADTKGLRFERPFVLSSPHPLGEIAFEDCRVPVANRLVEEGRGFALGLKTLDRLRPTVGAAACGMAARALAEALAHARARRQFGKPIAEFQLVQEKLARMAIELDAARLLVYRAAHLADGGIARNTLAAAMAKSYATEAAQRIVDDAVQVLGGAGVLASHPVDRLYRSVRALRIYEGTTEIQHLVIAAHMLAEAERERARMKVACIGGGPAGLFFSLLLKRDDPSHDVVVYERNRPDDTFGFGVVFSDATEEALASADPETIALMAAHCHRWDDIEIHYQGEVLTSTGHGFSGLSRRTLLELLAGRCRAAGVRLCFERDVSDPETLRDADLVFAADGVNSMVRERYREHFQPETDVRPNRFVWLGTTRPFPAFTFYFKPDAHGLWRVHAYQYEPDRSTFIVEAREETWRAAGLEHATEADTIAFCERLFATELNSHRLVSNRSIWRSFPTIRNARWHHGNVVLAGDAAHTAHFSVGSGTKLAMEDAIALAAALKQHRAIPDALEAYETGRRPAVESLQRAARASLMWFEDTERYMKLEPLQFAFTLLTRSLRVTHDNLRVRDPVFVAKVDRWFEQQALKQVAAAPPGAEASSPAHSARGDVAPTPLPLHSSQSATIVPPPMFTPFRLRELVLPNRVVVSPMCQYQSEDGTPGDWHLVHLGSRAMGGAGLVFAEMTDVSAEARISLGCTGLYKPEHVPAWRRIVDFVHGQTPAKIGIQLGHAGRKAATKRLWEGDNEPLPEGAWPTLAPSALPYYPHSPVPREMTRADMDQTIADFERATGYAIDAGFDLLEIHMAHGYLLATFISPLTNQRTDAYGGALENRMRYPLEVFDAVRAKWPAEKPMSVRISAVDWLPGGMEPDDAVEVARLLKAHGCDVVDVSAGQTVADQRPVYGRLFQTPFADRIRHEVGIATMAVGNISSYSDVNTILAAGRADLCLLARAHLWDPYWTRHAAYELGYPLRWPDSYETLNRYRPRFI